MAMGLNLRLLIIPPEHRTIKRGKALLIVNNWATYQRQSWIPEAPGGKQATASNDNHPVPAIIEEHKLNFNPCMNSLLFTQDPEDCITLDVHQADHPNAHNVNQGMCDTLKVPITTISDANIASCTTHWMGKWKYKAPYATWMELTEEGNFLRIYCRELYSQPDLKMPCQLSAK